MKITGTPVSELGGFDGGVEFTIDIDLRDLFAAFALAAVVGLDLEEATHESDAAYAYAAADAMLKAHTTTGDEG